MCLRQVPKQSIASPLRAPASAADGLAALLRWGRHVVVPAARVEEAVPGAHHELVPLEVLPPRKRRVQRWRGESKSVLLLRVFGFFLMVHWSPALSVLPVLYSTNQILNSRGELRFLLVLANGRERKGRQMKRKVRVLIQAFPSWPR